MNLRLIILQQLFITTEEKILDYILTKKEKFRLIHYNQQNQCLFLH